MTTNDNSFIGKLRKEVDDNLTNDQFGVEELARNIGMSRSQLHRKLASVTGQSVSQFIREHRLERGMELLKQGGLTAAEVADQVGFGSATYFSKCFVEYYGFTPIEARSRPLELMRPSVEAKQRNPRSRWPIAVVAAVVTLIVVALFFYFRDARQSPGDKSIAVLPFKNLSEDQTNTYFSEGMMDAIHSSLSQVGELRVISRTSVEQYRGSSKPASEIASELGVLSLFEGSIQRDNNKVRIDVRLVDGRSGELVWAKTFDRELKDIFAIQTEIAQNVAAELHATLTAEERSRISKADTDDPRAYDLFLKGMYEYRTYTNAGAHNAIDLMSQAVAIDSNYALAYAWLANSHIGLASIWGAELSAIEALQNGKPYIEKALKLDPGLDMAHMLAGFFKLYHDWDLDGAEREYRQAIVNDHPDALAMYIDYLNFTLRKDEAMMFSERLNTKDPYYPNSRMTLSYIFNKRFDEALEFSESRLKTFSNYYTLDSHGFLLLNMGRYLESTVYFDKVIALEGIRYPRMLGWMGAAYAKAGDRAKAMEIITELKDRLNRGETGGSLAFFIAVIYSALDDKQQALTWLDTAYRSHDMEMPWLISEPQFQSLQQEPAFQKMATSMGFRFK